MFEGLLDVTYGLVRQYGYIAVFVFLFLETSMLFPFLPSELVVPFAAGVVVTGVTSMLGFGVAAGAGAVVGGYVAYYAFGGGTSRLLDRAKRLLHVEDAETERATKWFEKYGEHSVLWGRLLPFLRSVISIPAGMAGMDRLKFGVYTGVGAFVFNTAVAAVVFYGKQQSVYHVAVAYLTDHPVVAGVGALALLTLWYAAERTDPWSWLDPRADGAGEERVSK
ncbi:DedA family protein [Halobium salinum]|uniref:DedA family protein n=1 Tax=Halobium salinum TaxID=1364940 RepID=A0ABD5PGJ0_9EURY|nr:VTT domain-containing protein [Halobium salinum]